MTDQTHPKPHQLFSKALKNEMMLGLFPFLFFVDAVLKLEKAILFSFDKAFGHICKIPVCSELYALKNKNWSLRTSVN